MNFMSVGTKSELRVRGKKKCYSSGSTLLVVSLC